MAILPRSVAGVCGVCYNGSEVRWMTDRQIERESLSASKNADKKWIEDFLAMPHDYEQTADEAKDNILKNRQFGVTRIIKDL